jgi:hypothetical protein
MEEQTNDDLEEEYIDIDNNIVSDPEHVFNSSPTESAIGLEFFWYVRAADCYTNMYIAYRILFTLFVVVALAERSFSKLKLLKNPSEVYNVAREVKWFGYYMY